MASAVRYSCYLLLQLDINVTTDQSNEFRVEPTMVTYYQKREVKATKILSWLNNIPCKLYMELVRFYLLYINWSLHIKLFPNIDYVLIPYANWDHNYDRCNVNIQAKHCFYTPYINKAIDLWSPAKGLAGPQRNEFNLGS